MKNTLVICAVLVVSLFFGNAFAIDMSGTPVDWSKFDPTDLGDRVVEWDYTGVRPIAAVDAVGVHPRIFFGPGDLAEMRQRLATTDCGIEVMAQINAYKQLMYLGYPGAGKFDYDADYNIDPQGNRRISNANYYNTSAEYAALVAGDMTAMDGMDALYKHNMIGCMAVMAFKALIEDDVDLAEDIAAAITTWVNIASPSYGPATNMEEMGKIHMALCYDLIYNYMTPSQRDTVRAGIAQMLENKYHYGAFLEPYAATHNWTTLDSFLPVIAMSIEGELDAAGNTNTENIYKSAVRSFHNFLTYGWHESGCPHEGHGKNYQFVTTFVAMARRGEKFVAHPHVRAYGEKHLTAMIQPYGYAFTAYDDWGGTGNVPVVGGWRFNSHDAVGLKWIFPDSDVVDFVWRNWAGEYYAAKDIQPKGYNNDLLCMAIFASDYADGDWDFAGLGKPLGYLAPRRGLATMRSSFDTDALYMHLHCRQDIGRHTHADRNNIIFSAMGRIWGNYRTASGGGETGQLDDLKYHSGILIDGKGIGLCDNYGYKAMQPAKFVSFDDFEMATFATGDAKYAYDWEWEWDPYPPEQDNPLIGQGWEKVMETPNDFLYKPGEDHYYDVPYYYRDEFNQPGMLERYVKRLYNPMEKAFRTAGIVRGDKPYGLVIDDYKKDGGYHNYQWIMQLEGDLSIDSSIAGINASTDAVLKGSSGTERLLVRILQVESSFTAAPQMDTIIEPRYEVDYWKRLNIHAYTTIDPKYKVMLYPFRVGDNLPATFWQSDQLTIMIGDQVDVYDFSVNGRGITEFTITRGGEMIFTSGCDEVFVGGDVSGDGRTDLEDVAEVSESWGFCYRLEDLARVAGDWLNVYNYRPMVNAGSDDTVELGQALQLGAEVSDDGLPGDPGAVTMSWRKIGGPGDVTFVPNATVEDPEVVFDAIGGYTLGLTVWDGEKSMLDTVSIEVTAMSEPGLPDAVAHYQLDEATGIGPLDATGNTTAAITYHGTTDAPVLLAGNVGVTHKSGAGAWQFWDDSDDATLATGNGVTITGSAIEGLGAAVGDEISVAFWLKGTGGDTYARIVENLDGTLDIRRSAANDDVNVYLAGINIYTFNNVLDGQWHHLAITVEIGGTFRAYLDGSEVNSQSYTAGAINTTNKWAIASRGPDGNSRFFGGGMDDVRIYDVELSAGEVTLIANPDVE